MTRNSRPNSFFPFSCRLFRVIIYTDSAISVLLAQGSAVLTPLRSHYKGLVMGQNLVEFTITDGLTPLQIEKLNYNFRLLASGASAQDQKGVEINLNAYNANLAAESARKAATDAMQYAEDGHQAYYRINEAEVAAGKSLTVILQDAIQAAQAANDAKILADAANQSAINANASAVGALNSLSDVEKVVGALEWVSSHAEYGLTDDITPMAGKWYFMRSGSGTAADPYYYTVTSVPDDYVITFDTEAVPGKDYYSRSGLGTEQSPYVYTRADSSPTYSLTEDESPVDGKVYYVLESSEYVVADVSEGFVSGTDYYEAEPFDPTGYYEAVPGNPHALGLYEMTDVTESVRDYLTAHVAVDQAGLYVQLAESSNSTRVLLSPTRGVVLYDQAGREVASYGASTVIGKSDGPHVKVTQSGIDFYSGTESEETRVGYIETVNGISVFRMTNAVIVKELRFGHWMWAERESDHMLYLKWRGDE